MDDRLKSKDQLIRELSELRAKLKHINESQAFRAAQETEEALRISEEKYRSIFENATEGIFQSTPEGRFISVNPAFVKMCGFSTPDEMIASIHDISTQHYATPEKRLAFVELLEQNGRVENFIHQILRKDGEKIWVSTNARTVKDEKGKTIYYEGTHENITKHKQAEEELCKSEAMLKSIFRAAPIGIGIVHDRILGWTNDYLSIITGYSHDELRGKSARILYPTDEEFKWVGDVKYRQIQKQGIGSVETRWLKKDGLVIDVFLSSGYVNPSDPAEGLVFTALDITEHKAAENTLHYYTGLLHLVLDVSTSFINLSPGEIDEGIRNALKMIGQFVKVDRSYLFQFREDGLLMDNTHEWCSQGTTAQIDRLQGITQNDMPWFFSQIQKLDFLHIPDIEKLPEEAYSEKNEFRLENIKSLVTVPITYSSGSLIGFLGLDSVQQQKVWSQDEISVLKVVGEIFANVLFRKRYEEDRKVFEEKLIESEERYRTSIENSNDGVAIVKKDNHLYVNKKFVQIFGYDSAEEIIGQPVTITVHPDDREKVRNINKKRQDDNGAPSRYEFKEIKKMEM